MTDPNTAPMITPVEKTAYNKHFLKNTQCMRRTRRLSEKNKQCFKLTCEYRTH